jgi:acyl carrier protein
MVLMDKRVRAVFREVFDDDHMEVWDAMSAKDVIEWDSLAQVKLIIGLEEEFQIKFTIHEVAQMTCVGDLKRSLLLKGVAR